MVTPDQFKEARQLLGFTQQGLADEWGMGNGRTIRKWESGERPVSPLAAYALRLMAERQERPQAPTP